MRGNFSIVHSNFSYSDILSLPYFENWLGGFTTAEGCFSIRASGRRRAHDARRARCRPPPRRTYGRRPPARQYRIL